MVSNALETFWPTTGIPNEQIHTIPNKKFLRLNIQY